MGIYVNPGNEAFAQAVCSEIYIDKSMLISVTNEWKGTLQKNICVSRPRRFGKSIAANMLVAYYSRGCDSGELFRELRISKHGSFMENLNQYNVIHLNMQRFLNREESVHDMLDAISEKVVRELKRAYPDISYYEDYLVSVLEEIYQEKKEKFIFIIDEWDCVFRVMQKNVDAQKEYLDFLRDMLKDQPYVELAYMTGILPIKKYGEHSALNMFDEYSMTNQGKLAEYTGFTEQEVETICGQYHMPFDEMRRWYDGYQLQGISVYNPKSVVTSALRQVFDNYWTQTETYEALKKYIQLDQYGLKDTVAHLIAGDKVPVNPAKFQNDMTTFDSADDVLTLLVHLGYLTYDFYEKKVWIPNSEVQQEFINSIEDGGFEPVMDAIRKSEDLLEATLDMQAGVVAESIEQAHQENTSLIKYNDENSLACVLSLAYYSARKKYVMYRELAGGKGFADLVFVPRKNCQDPALIVELKWNESEETAIRQILEKRYAECLKDYNGTVLLVGITYDKKSKRHACRIEKIDK